MQKRHNSESRRGESLTQVFLTKKGEKMKETAREYYQSKYGELTAEEQKLEALNLFKTTRGSFVLGQALYHGIKALMSVDPPVMREQSNIADMYLLTSLFFPYEIVGEFPHDKVEALKNVTSTEGSELEEL